MEKINIVIPMAGEGSRFVKAGYSKPKPFINVNGRPMIAHVLENLNVANAKYILIAREEHLNNNPEDAKYISDNFNVEFISISKLTLGAACTVLSAHRFINNNTPLLIANSDQIVDIDINKFTEDAKKRHLDGSILTFQDNNPKWSYAKLNQENLVTEVKEKSVISTNATVGIYYFSKGNDFVNHAIDMIVANDTVNNEFYVCPVYNYLIRNHLKIGIFNIKQNQMHGTGTPEDLDKYLAGIKK
ncbi:dTDP-glucose pyrophosphorylase [Elusimicrobium posterum]|uniref:glycosyltransferase family 2 protein n=1 Tax=Elusimicrobium posterum TaxID=3116653 RepID=UPI003C72511A